MSTSNFIQILNSCFTVLVEDDGEELSIESIMINENILTRLRDELIDAAVESEVDVIYELLAFAIMFSYFSSFETLVGENGFNFIENWQKFIMLMETSEIEIRGTEDISLVLDTYYCEKAGLGNEESDEL